MTDEMKLDPGERQWLLAIERGPMTKSAADGSVPAQIRDSLIDKKLVQWKYGFLEVALLEITSRGQAEAQRLRATMQAA